MELTQRQMERKIKDLELELFVLRGFVNDHVDKKVIEDAIDDCESTIRDCIEVDNYGEYTIWRSTKEALKEVLKSRQ